MLKKLVCGIISIFPGITYDECVGENPVFPGQVSRYSLIDETEISDCEEINENSNDLPPGFDNFGTVCQEGFRLQYQNDNDEGVFIHLIDTTKGKNIFDELLELSYAEKVFLNVFRLENHELFWFPDRAWDLILTQEFTSTTDEHGTSYNYGVATGEDPVTEWSITNYPPENPPW